MRQSKETESRLVIDQGWKWTGEVEGDHEGSEVYFRGDKKCAKIGCSDDCAYL